jgi:hypothetical protein
MPGTLRVVSAVSIVSSLIGIFHPPDPCHGILAFTMRNACEFGGLDVATLLWGGFALVVGIVGLIASFRKYPSTPI